MKQNSIHKALKWSGLSAVGALVYSIVEARWAHTVTTNIDLRRNTGPSADAGHTITIAQLADIHMHGWSGWLRRFLLKNAALRPIDFAINTGDNFSTPAGFRLLRSVFSPTSFGRFPGAFVFGSNDYYSATFKFPGLYPLVRWLDKLGLEDLARRIEPTKKRVKDLPYKEFAEFLRGIGWHDLRNAATDVTVSVDNEDGAADLHLSLLGLDDPHINREIYPALPPGWKDADVRIGVVHAPYARVLDALTALGADLIIAGHTHGGQIRVPKLGALVNNCDIPLTFSSGLHRWQRGTVTEPKPRQANTSPDLCIPKKSLEQDLPALLADPDAPTDTLLYVSQGLGANVFTPIRMTCRPTLDLLRIRL